MTDKYDEIQPRDTTDAETAVDNTIEKRAREHKYQQRLEGQAHVRELMQTAEEAFAGVTDTDPDDVLNELSEYLADSEGIAEVLSPRYDGLEAYHKVLFKRLSRLRRRRRAGEGVSIPLEKEYKTYVRIAIEIGHIHAATDRTRYAPVSLASLAVPGARSPVEGDPSPIGRVRVGSASTTELEERATEIEHKDAEHVLAIANPRKGKDSLISRICGNLKDEHGYKWISIFDDGRFETSMIAIPNDEEAIRENLETFGQEPKGYKTEVFVPAVDLPDELPGNHVPFTIGVDSLTTDMVAQLSGVNPASSTERRIKHALEKVQDGRGSVDELIRLLEKYADETSAEITVTELKDQDEIEGAEVDSVTRTYELGEDKVLQECAQSLMMLASEGLLRDRGADTNLDMVDVLQDQEHVAVLNSNFLSDGDEHLKYLIVNIWLRMIYRARDDNPWLPRAAVEMREIKELAPSVLERAKYSSIAKSLRQTVFFLSSQGGSRRVLMLGSTQYLNDVYKPIRGNMPLKILLTLGSEKIRTLESAGYQFSEEEQYQLKSFKVGWGMLLQPDGKTYPINWAGARCGLGLGDLEWLDRYGLAMGFRVQFRGVSDLEEWEHDADRYVDRDGDLQPAPPSHREWYLLERDLEEHGVGLAGGVQDDTLRDVLEERQDYSVPQDLRPEPVGVTTEQRDLELVSTEEANERERNEVYQRYDVTGALRGWVNRKESTIGKYQEILRTVDRNEVGSYGDLSDLTGYSESSIKQYMNPDKGGLRPCLEKEGGLYHLTPLGHQSLEIPWSAVFDKLN